MRACLEPPRSRISTNRPIIQTREFSRKRVYSRLSFFRFLFFKTFFRYFVANWSTTVLNELSRSRDALLVKYCFLFCFHSTYMYMSEDCCQVSKSCMKHEYRGCKFPAGVSRIKNDGNFRRNLQKKPLKIHEHEWKIHVHVPESKEIPMQRTLLLRSDSWHWPAKSYVPEKNKLF